MAKKKPTSFRKAVTSQVSDLKQSRTRPFRDLYADGVTYTFLAEFLGCREQARLSYVEGYTQSGFIEPFAFGSCAHACFEQAIRTRHNFDHSKVIKQFFKSEITKQQLKSFEIKELDRVCKTVEVMWPVYQDYWRKKAAWDFDPRTEYIVAEEKFKFEHVLPDGRSVPIYGFCDAVLRQKNDVRLMENKTKSQVDDMLDKYLPYDMQTGLYCYAIRRCYGVEPTRVLYNVLKRPSLRQKQMETTPEFIKRIQQDVETRPDHYFLRLNSLLSPGDIDKFVQKVLNPVLMQVVDWWEEISKNPFNPWAIPNSRHHFMNPEALYTKYGRSNYFDYLTCGVDTGLKRRMEKKVEPKAKRKGTR